MRLGMIGSSCVRDGSGQAHYGRVRDTEAYRDLHVGSVAELGAGTQRRQQVAEQIAAVADNRGFIRRKLHEAYLRKSQPDSTDRQIASSVRSADVAAGVRRWVRGSGVRALEDR